MKKKRHKSTKSSEFLSEEMEWLYLTPAQRMHETTKLWQLFIAMRGNLDPEPDPQSPFYFQKK